MTIRSVPTQDEIPDERVIPRQVAFTTEETAIWLGFMQPGTTGKAKAAAVERVQYLIRHGQLRARGTKYYIISGGAIRDFLNGIEPIARPESA